MDIQQVHPAGARQRGWAPGLIQAGVYAGKSV